MAATDDDDLLRTVLVRVEGMTALLNSLAADLRTLTAETVKRETYNIARESDDRRFKAIETAQERGGALVRTIVAGVIISGIGSVIAVLLALATRSAGS